MSFQKSFSTFLKSTAFIERIPGDPAMEILALYKVTTLCPCLPFCAPVSPPCHMGFRWRLQVAISTHTTEALHGCHHQETHPEECRAAVARSSRRQEVVSKTLQQN